MSKFYDFKRLHGLWEAAAGRNAGHSDWPGKEKAAGYFPLRAANYLLEEFKSKHKDWERSQFFRVSRARAKARSAEPPKRSTHMARTFKEALVGALRKSKTVDIAYFQAHVKGQRAIIETAPDRARPGENKAALANIYRTLRKLTP